MKRPWWLLLAVAAATVVILAALFVRWQIRQVERESSALLSQRSQISFSLGALQRPLPAQVEVSNA